MDFYEQDLLIVWHDHAKFGGNRFSGNRNIMLLVWRVIEYDYVGIGSCD